MDVLPQADDIAIDLLTQLLQFNPDKRIMSDQCLVHPFVSRFRVALLITPMYVYCC